MKIGNPVIENIITRNVVFIIFAVLPMPFYFYDLEISIKMCDYTAMETINAG